PARPDHPRRAQGVQLADDPRCDAAVGMARSLSADVRTEPRRDRGRDGEVGTGAVRRAGRCASARLMARWPARNLEIGGEMDNAASAPAATQTSPVEIFSIGTELLLGRIQDTNSHWLAEHISELGGTVARITIVGDDREVIHGALRGALDRGARTV